MPDRLTCCVCGGAHHPMSCAIAQEYMRQCLDSRISPAPTPPPIPVTETVASREDPIAREIRSARHHRSVWQRNG